ncbi:TIGR00297 family protein [Natronoarchaeum philippinense]|uniref:TIGR00297 family protein n=1 Tax=Natronoarchaeum philippinense TaxID=558529 RepID=A0A285NAR4_NATPI|nr:DUF92 domain-containing protein [Natronoarchaeum philippinense]SNZ06565.1 TIGR00297 family protein [Natronoarchaeum philippinense]
MTSTVRRAGAFAAVGTLSLLAAVAPAVAVAAFAAVAIGAATITDGAAFELFARPGDRRDERLKGLVGFAVAAGLLGAFAAFGELPATVFVGTVVLYSYGNFVGEIARNRLGGEVFEAVGFVVGGLIAGVVGVQATAMSTDAAVLPLAEVTVLATSGALVGALLRSILLGRDDPPVLLSVGFLLWLLAELDLGTSTPDVLVALAVTAALGYASYALETASVEGMLAGVVLAFLAIVLGGYPWFAVMIAFFGIGGLSTKFRYDQKRDRGVAEDNDGARGSANVLGNAAVALVAVLGYATAAAGLLPVDPAIFTFAFAGSLATALADTLSSEVGGVFDTPRLITTLERVEPGTDGGVTWQGELAGIAGAAVVAALSGALFSGIAGRGALVIASAGVVGMTVDSLLGATIEGDRIGNQSVNFLATLSGGIAGTLLALAVGLAAFT